MTKAKIIAVANLKGGATKSTTTINLAVAAESAGIPAGIIDVDARQQASAVWSDSRQSPRPPVYSAVYTRLPKEIADLEREGAALILIDCPADNADIAKEAIRVADLVLIPTQATPTGLRYVPATHDIAASLQKPTAVLLCGVETQLKEFGEAKAFIENNGLALAPMHISKAVSSYRYHSAGLGITEAEPNSKAAQEVRSLLEWISILLDLSPSGRVEEVKQSRSSIP
jgi:chromosome partitioning protein